MLFSAVKSFGVVFSSDAFDFFVLLLEILALNFSRVKKTVPLIEYSWEEHNRQSNELIRTTVMKSITE